MKSFLGQLKISKFEMSLAIKLLFSRRALFGGSAPLALMGLILGVACLIVSMAVMSGFESTLQKAMADVTGHVRLVRTAKPNDDWQVLVDKIKKLEPTLEGATRFASVEAIVAHKGALTGVLIQGVDSEHYSEVLRLQSRLIEGSVDLPGALIGKGLQKKLQLQVGDEFRVVLPVNNGIDPSSFRRQVGTFKVTGVLDLGKYEWNERFILTDLTATQKLAEIGEKYTGLILRFKEITHARDAGFHLSQNLGNDYWIRDWRDANENLFDAVNIERIVIFFVVLIIVIVAAFNVSSTLYINVLQRYNDIAIFKTLGLKSSEVLKIFSFQGLLIGSVGLLGGGILGLILCQLFMWGQTHLGLIPGSVYKVDTIQVQIRGMDLLMISVATLTICFLATLSPARKGSKLNPVEGLKYG